MSRHRRRRVWIFLLVAAILFLGAMMMLGAPSRVDLLVMNARFRNGEALVTDAGARDMVERAAAYWREASYGKLDVRVSYAPLYVIPKDDPGVCDSTSWNADAITAAVAAGATGNYFVYIIPGCRSAEGALGSNGTWISNPSAQTVAHELGHNFGLNHNRARRCAPWQAFPPDNCDLIEYGGVSVMGAGFRHPSILEKAMLGWAPYPQTIPRTNGVRRIPVGILETSGVGVSVSVERFQGGGVYLAERRAPIGFDAGLYPGIAIYWNQEYLDFVAEGVTWRDTASGVGFKLVGDTIDVDVFDGPAPTPTPTPGPVAEQPTPGPVDPGCHLPPEYCAPLRTATPTPTASPAPPTATETPFPAPTATPEPPVAEPPTVTPTPPPTQAASPTATPPPPTPTRPAPPPSIPPSRRGCSAFSLSSVVLIAVGMAGWRRRIRR